MDKNRGSLIVRPHPARRQTMKAASFVLLMARDGSMYIVCFQSCLSKPPVVFMQSPIIDFFGLDFVALPFCL